MTDTVYLIANKRGILRHSKKRPTLKAGEVASQVCAVIDNKVFDNPYTTITVNIREEDFIKPPVQAEVVPQK